jgi:hypothetical protein
MSVQDGVKTKTIAGSLVTVLSTALILVLLITELRVFTTTTTEHHLTIDPSTENSLVKISLHATFFHLPCSEINLDLEATRGDSAADSDDTIDKFPAGEGCTLRGDLTVR